MKLQRCSALCRDWVTSTKAITGWAFCGCSWAGQLQSGSASYSAWQRRESACSFSSCCGVGSHGTPTPKRGGVTIIWRRTGWRTMSRRTNSIMGSGEGGAACRALALGRRRVSFLNGNGAGGIASPAFAKNTPRSGLGSFLPAMPLGQFLFEYLYRRGVRHSFGVPGDFALPTFTWLEKSKIQSVTMTHEPAAGFAADAYSRVNGIGLVCVTYCVGGLNVLNAIAGAYAEKSPVVVVSGAPGRKDREKDPLLHHKVKTFATQRRVYDEVTADSCVLLDEQRAASEIVRVVNACLRHKRPVYIEIPHDMADRTIQIHGIAPHS